ncbi:hypothetical protein L7F22_027141 [Adiantum nelumboides]|nr:hypothetical protein [Adiantum nelumboides]
MDAQLSGRVPIETHSKAAPPSSLCANSVENMAQLVKYDFPSYPLPKARSPDIRASSWNNRMRDAAIKLSGKIPEVGAVVSILVSFFWPEDQVDIFEALKADMTKLVKEEILKYELNRHQSEIDGLKVIIQRYKAAKLHEKGYFLNSWITQADQLSVIFRQSNNNFHLISPTITLALLHLIGLRERLDFGKDLYQEDNTKQWKKDLEEMYKTYIVEFLPNIFQK